MKGGITRRIDDTIAALEKGQIKKALYLTEGNEKLGKHHGWVQDAARTCLANKGNKEACEQAIKEARNKVQETITLPIDDTSLEGLEEYLEPRAYQPPKPEVPDETEITVQPQVALEVQPHIALEVQPQSVETEMTDEELYESCEDCHVAVAAAQFVDICADRPGEAGGACEIISKNLEDEDTTPVDWLKAMIEVTEGAEGRAKEAMQQSFGELHEYLEGRDSPFLKEINEDNG